MYIYKGHKVRRNFGQVFLNDNKIIHDIISIINPKTNQTIIEIGPGLGSLTKVILNYIDLVTVIELDQNLVNRLALDKLLINKINILNENVLTVNFTELSHKIGKPLRIFGNLPYNISVCIILHLLKYINIISDMHFMLQEEVADRLVSKPNSKKYGRLSVITQYFCKIKKIIKILPRSFKPIPKVNSAIISMIPYKNSILKVNVSKLINITKIAFSQRRKKLFNSLKKILNLNKIDKLNIDFNMRAENLSIKDYCYLANEL